MTGLVIGLKRLLPKGLMLVAFLSLVSGLFVSYLGVSGAFAAPSPFGVALPETGGIASTSGWWGEIQSWILARQSEFYLALKNTVKAIESDPLALWGLLGLSFAYGAFHAAGPGHGKVVLTTYLFASGATARRGAVLALIAALVQASVAVGLIAIAALALNLTSMVITQTAMVLELASYALFVVLGLWLLMRAFGSWRALQRAGNQSHDHSHSHDHRHDDHSHDHHDPHHHHHDHASGECGCGHNHVPGIEMVEQAQSLKTMAIAVISMGLRPCSGALIVLVFALSQNVFWAGVLSAYAMGLGTGLSVAVLALFATYARYLSQSLAYKGLSHRAVDWFGMLILALAGIVVAGFGLVLLLANLL
ncbi:MAG: nickel/cobalt transporter [Cohaesibacter sp.]|nr:nickel/cobalt transporter [Cohaesibacter sp.]